MGPLRWAHGPRTMSRSASTICRASAIILTWLFEMTVGRGPTAGRHENAGPAARALGSIGA